MAGSTRTAALPWRYLALALLLNLLVLVAYLALRDAPALRAIEGQGLNWRFQLRGPLPSPPGVVIVAIDDRTVAALRRWPLPRRMLAEVVGKLNEAGAAAIGLDLLLLDREQPSDGVMLSPGDLELLNELRRADNDVLALAFTFTPGAVPGATALQIAGDAAFRVVRRPAGPAEDDVLRATGMLAPVGPLYRFAAVAHVNTPVDDDGVLRAMPAAIAFGGHYVPSFPLALSIRRLGLAPGEVALLLERGLVLGDRVLQLDRRLSLPVNYYGPAGTMRTISLIDLLEDRVAVADVAGRTVLVGTTALGLGDTFVAPFSQTLPGVEALATMTGNLLAGQVPEHAALQGWNVAAIFLLGLAAFVLARLPSPVAVVAAGSGLLLAWVAAAQIAFNRGWWLDMTFPTAAILLTVGSVAIVRAAIERRLRRNLSRYHSPVIVDMLAENATPSFEGRSQNAAILFVDIAGFTSRIERLPPADTVTFLRDFHGRIERAVLAHGGVLEQFMGDGAMVIFGVPTPKAEDAASALACARDLVEDIRQRNAQLVAQGQAPFDLSVGIHYGPVVIARLGGPTQAQITAAGDTVNVASRLETLTRAHGATIAISDAVVDAVGAVGRVDLLAGFEELPNQTIRGRVERLVVWIARDPRRLHAHG